MTESENNQFKAFCNIVDYFNVYKAKGATSGTPAEIYHCEDWINSLEAYELAAYKRPVIELDASKKYLAIGWADYFLVEDPKIMLALGTKYDFQQTFYRQIRPKTDDYLNTFYYNRDELKMIEKQGSKDADHAYLHISMIFSHPKYDGRLTPSNDDLRVVRTDGTNGFGWDTSVTVDDSIGASYRESWLNLSAELGATAWEDLTDADCIAFRKSVGAFGMPLDGQSEQKVLEGMDILSARYCGTTGQSVYDDYITRTPNTVDGLEPSINNPIIGGIFQGAISTENHELWERCLTILDKYKREFEGKKEISTFITTPGGTNSGLMYSKVDAPDLFQKFHDNNYELLSTGACPIYSGTLGSIRSLHDAMATFGMKLSMFTSADGYADSGYDSLSRLECQRLYQRNLPYKKVNNVGDGYKNALRQWQPLYTATDVTNALASNDAVKYLYDLTATDPRFTSLTAFAGGSLFTYINQFITFITWGIIPDSVGDSNTSPDQQRSSIALGHEAIMQFCKRANIYIISHEQAYDVSQIDYSPTNWFPNHTFETTPLTVLNSVNAPLYPDGWNGGELVDDSGDAYYVSADGTYFIRQYAIKPGSFNLSFSAKGVATIYINTILNNNAYRKVGGGFQSAFTKTININSVGVYDSFSQDFTIDNAALENYETPITPQDIAYQNYMKRYGDKICGIQIDIIIAGGNEMYLKSPIIN